MAYKYTQADVEAMSDAELSRLASALRFGEEITWDIWSPATDRNQSGEFEQRESPGTWRKIVAVKGATARSETVAAVCALLAIEGRISCTS